MSFAALILAAGKSTRMHSDISKVLHPIAGKPMLRYGLDTLAAMKPDKIAVVTGAGMKDVADAARPAEIVIQDPPRGTGHAVQCAKDFWSGYNGPVLVLYGDTPFLTADTLQEMLDRVRDGCAVAVLGFYPDDAAQYGRLILDQKGGLEKIVEFADCDAAQKTVSFCNAGLMAVDGKHLPALMAELKNDNKKGEFYLTDLVAIARRKNLNCAAIEVAPFEVMGINDRMQLAAAEVQMQLILRQQAMQSGVTLVDPASVYFAHDTKIGRDVVIEPNVFFGPGVRLGDKVHIKAFCHIEGAVIEQGAIVGPFARLRPGSKLGEDVHIGNFVEIKNATLHSGVKAGHLSYLGDAEIGGNANIGAGTVICNYDGFEKHRSVIGAGAFIGSNSALVSPVEIGAGAIVGAGSVITADVPDDALALGRAPQTVKPGWAKRFRDFMLGRKNKKTA